MGLPRSVTSLTERQGGCVSVRQLIALSDVSQSQVYRWRQRGLLPVVHRGVVRVAGAPETDEQRLWAALLRCGEHALLGPRATCWLYGLEGFSELVVDVVVKAPHRVRGTPFPATTRKVSSSDWRKHRGFAALSVPRVIVELAHTLAPKELRVLIDSARRKRLTTIEVLRRTARRLASTPGCRRGAAAVLALVSSGQMDKESENEREIADFLATTTLQLDWQVTDLVPGRRLDAVDREAMMILEIDSRLWHSLGSDRDRDGLRDLEIGEEDDYLVSHITLGMVRFTADETRQRLDSIRARRCARRGG